jgi:hypothetical protein
VSESKYINLRWNSQLNISFGVFKTVIGFIKLLMDLCFRCFMTRFDDDVLRFLVIWNVVVSWTRDLFYLFVKF